MDFKISKRIPYKEELFVVNLRPIFQTWNLLVALHLNVGQKCHMTHIESESIYIGVESDGFEKININ